MLTGQTDTNKFACLIQPFFIPHVNTAIKMFSFNMHRNKSDVRR